MEKFIVFFKDYGIQKTIKNMTNQVIEEIKKEENLKELDYDSKSIGFKLINDPNQLNEFVLILQKAMNLEFLLVIDNKEDICYIYVAKGSLKDIKETTMTDVSEAYKIITNYELFISRFEDLRFITKLNQKNPILN